MFTNITTILTYYFLPDLSIKIGDNAMIRDCYNNAMKNTIMSNEKDVNNNIDKCCKNTSFQELPIEVKFPGGYSDKNKKIFRQPFLTLKFQIVEHILSMVRDPITQARCSQVILLNVFHGMVIYNLSVKEPSSAK